MAKQNQLAEREKIEAVVRRDRQTLRALPALLPALRRRGLTCPRLWAQLTACYRAIWRQWQQLLSRVLRKKRFRYLKQGLITTGASVALISSLAIPPSPAYAAVTSAVDISGNLTISSDGTDNITVTCAGGNVQINGADPDSGLALCAAITSITVTATSGDANDIDLSGVTTGSFTLLSSVNVNSGGGNDTITGSQIADSLNGAAGNDSIVGGEGNDTLLGDSGLDTLVGGLGLDDVSGGDDDDTILWVDNDSSDTLEGGGGTLDIVQVTGAATDEAFTISTLPANRVSLTRTSPNFSLDMGTVERLTLNSGAGNDTITADAGLTTLAMSLNGGTGNDSIVGSGGNDTLFGDFGLDTLVGGLGTDSVTGGDDDDLILWVDNENSDTLNGGNGTLDTVQVTGAATNEAFTISTLPGNRVSLTRTNPGPIFSLNMGTIERLTLDSGDGNDTITSNAGLTTLAMSLNGGAGNDSITSGGSTDTLLGGLDNDTLQGNAGNDQVSGEDGDDLLIWNSGHNNDTLEGGPGSDTMQVNGAATGDQFVFSANGTRLRLDRTDLLFQVDIGTVETLTVNSGDGADTITVTDLTGVADLGLINVDGGLANDSLGVNTLTLLGVVALGGDGNDTLFGGGGADSLTGGLGNDSLLGDNGIDTLLGSDGNDTLQGGNSNDSLAGEGGNDSLRGGGGVDTLLGGADNDTLLGNGSNDQVFGEDGDDLLVWEEGNGNDTLKGDDGLDTVQVNSGSASDQFTISANGSFPRLTRSNAPALQLDLETVETLAVNSGDEADTVTVNDLTGVTDLVRIEVDTGLGNDSLNAEASLSTIPIAGLGGDGIDTLIGGNGADSLSGGPGNDSLRGGVGDDTLVGGANDDTLVGNLGNDQLLAEEGVDLLLWNDGDGNDFIEGGADSDRLQVGGSAGADTFFATANGTRISFTRTIPTPVTLNIGTIEALAVNSGSGDDQLIVNNLTSVVELARVELDSDAGNDSLNASASVSNIQIVALGGDDDDTLIGGSGPDSLSGAAGSDSLVGNAGDDTLSGGNNSDTLTGGSGADTLNGEAGNDSLTGSSGNDALNGGPGNDSYVFENDWGNDVITEAPTGGADTLTLADVTKPLTLTLSSVNITDGSNTVTHNANNLESIVSGKNNDTFNVKASALISNGLSLDGEAHFQGDILNFDPQGLAVVTSTNSITVEGRQPLVHTRIEQVNLGIIIDDDGTISIFLPLILKDS